MLGDVEATSLVLLVITRTWLLMLTPIEIFYRIYSLPLYGLYFLIIVPTLFFWWIYAGRAVLGWYTLELSCFLAIYDFYMGMYQNWFDILIRTFLLLFVVLTMRATLLLFVRCCRRRPRAVVLPDKKEAVIEKTETELEKRVFYS